jgi:hypothetical protein
MRGRPGGDAANVPGYIGFLAKLGLVAPTGILSLRVAQAAVLAAGVWLCHAPGRLLLAGGVLLAWESARSERALPALLAGPFSPSQRLRGVPAGTTGTVPAQYRLVE